MVKIKICGLMTLNDISYVNEADVDFAGFIFAHVSKRSINIFQAEEMKKALNKKIKSVGVFVNDDIELIKQIAQKKIIDLVQLHGNETDIYIKNLRKYVNLPIIKAYRADEKLHDNIKNTTADYVLIDSFDKNQFGGTGKTFDYNIIPKTDKKIFLAGGLNIENIEMAIKYNPYCLDINSGVETDGKKDKKKISELVKKIHSHKRD